MGTPVAMEFTKTGTQTLTVCGTFKANPLLNSNYVVSIPVFEANFTDQLDTVVLVKVADGVNPETVRPRTPKRRWPPTRTFRSATRRR